MIPNLSNSYKTPDNGTSITFGVRCENLCIPSPVYRYVMNLTYDYGIKTYQAFKIGNNALDDQERRMISTPIRRAIKSKRMKRKGGSITPQYVYMMDIK